MVVDLSVSLVQNALVIAPASIKNASILVLEFVVLGHDAKLSITVQYVVVYQMKLVTHLFAALLYLVSYICQSHYPRE